MKVLFIHQNFPGQYLHLAQHLRAVADNEVVGVGELDNIKRRGTIGGITTLGYPSPRKAGEATHHYLQPTEAAVRRGQAAARVLLGLKQKGFEPDVISVHPGWGEGLFIRDIFPRTPIAMFAEFYFRAGEADLGFDPEFPRSLDWDFSVRLRNIPQLVSLPSANVCLSPTRWQASRYPAHIRRITQILHDGIDTDFMSPGEEEVLTIQPLKTPGESRIVGPSGAPALGPNEVPEGGPLRLNAKDEVIVYMARNLEPYRGFHVFMRALPKILARRPKAQVLIIGSNGTSYSPPPPDGETYKNIYLKEVRDDLDFFRVHFLGRIPYAVLRSAFRIASVHVCLTYPFVLSWSTLEAMACEGLVLASDTAPVREVIEDGRNGLLTDFFDQNKLADNIDMVLKEPEAFLPLRKAARQTVLEHYALRRCLPEQVRLLTELASGMYPLPD